MTRSAVLRDTTDNGQVEAFFHERMRCTAARLEVQGPGCKEIQSRRRPILRGRSLLCDGNSWPPGRCISAGAKVNRPKRWDKKKDCGTFPRLVLASAEVHVYETKLVNSFGLWPI